jgi:hypothetical protein
MRGVNTICTSEQAKNSTLTDREDAMALPAYVGAWSMA